MVHVLDAVDAGHALPPKCGACVTRVRICKPVPHDTEQLPQLSDQAVALQSTGHCAVLQVRVSLACGHSAPPFAGCTRVRLRTWVPVPQLFEHTLNPAHCSMLQSVGQSCALHPCASIECGHAAPPLEGAALLRARVRVPLPHDREHAPQAVKFFKSQSMGHACWLQVLTSRIAGHSAPPASGCTNSRVREREPPGPQDREHAVQLPNPPTPQSRAHMRSEVTVALAINV